MCSPVHINLIKSNQAMGVCCFLIGSSCFSLRLSLWRRRTGSASRLVAYLVSLFESRLTCGNSNPWEQFGEIWIKISMQYFLLRNKMHLTKWRQQTVDHSLMHHCVNFHTGLSETISFRVSLRVYCHRRFLVVLLHSRLIIGILEDSH